MLSATQPSCASATRKLGAEVILYDRVTESRDAVAAKLLAERGGTLVHAYGDPWIIEGQGSAGIEAAGQMKAGGIGYVKPDGGAFPTLAETNAFIAAAGAIPLITWLDGTSAGEADSDALLDLHAAGGAFGVNIIPDRNYKPGVEDRKLANLRKIVEASTRRDLFLVAGTEMNSPGNKFVDDFGTAELKPLLPHFVRGAHIIHGHTMLARACGLGYVSDWSRKAFRNAPERNNFYETLGQVLEPGRADALDGIDADHEPGRVLEHVFCALKRCRKV